MSESINQDLDDSEVHNVYMLSTYEAADTQGIDNTIKSSLVQHCSTYDQEDEQNRTLEEVAQKNFEDTLGVQQILGQDDWHLCQGLMSVFLIEGAP